MYLKYDVYIVINTIIVINDVTIYLSAIMFL